MKSSEELTRKLADETVAITGKLASMRRDEAIAAIRSAGGRYVPMPSVETTLVVVGAGGPPLGIDGRLTESLRRAGELERAGARLRVVGEEEWLALLDRGDTRVELHRLYTSEQLARILDVSVAEVRKWVRHRLIVPVRAVGRLAFFDFRQVASARALIELLGAGVPPARVRKSLEQLDDRFDGAALGLAQLEALESGAGVLVRLDDGRAAEPTGQLLLDFDPDPRCDPRSEPGGAPRRLSDARDALRFSAEATWFECGVRAEEEGCFEEAAYAYERAVAEDGPSAEAWFNLGNVRFVQNQQDRAARAFARALELEPDYVEAWNNFANVQSELGCFDEALAAYQRAIAIAPDYADAYYNCAETLLALGDEAGARRHWQAYLKRDPSSPWAAEVLKKLAALDGVPPP